MKRFQVVSGWGTVMTLATLLGCASGGGTQAGRAIPEVHRPEAPGSVVAGAQGSEPRTSPTSSVGSLSSGSSPSGSSPSGSSPSGSLSSGSSPSGSLSSGSSPSGSSPSGGSALELGGIPCGALGCRLFDSPEQAFAEVLRAEPRVIAIGESHAQKAAEAVRSTTAHFTDELLSSFQGRASDIVLELLLADGSCGHKTEAKVAEKQKPVTSSQRDTNQGEFLSLGNKAKALGIRPHVLRPSCQAYERVVGAGDDAVPAMLTMIAEETTHLVQAILDRNRRTGVDKTVLTYGGAMHNDVQPRPGTENWSFAAPVSLLVGGRYAEVDLIVPEFIGDTDTWKSLPWYPHFDRQAHPQKVTLFQPSLNSYVIIFATSRGTGERERTETR